MLVKLPHSKCGSFAVPEVKGKIPARNGAANTEDRGTMLWRMSKKFNFAAEKIIPDSFVFCVILMIVVYFLGGSQRRSAAVQVP